MVIVLSSVNMATFGIVMGEVSVGVAAGEGVADGAGAKHKQINKYPYDHHQIVYQKLF